MNARSRGIARRDVAARHAMGLDAAYLALEIGRYRPARPSHLLPPDTPMGPAAVPADVCIRALLAAGFVMRRRGGGIALLARGPRIVVVPDLPALEPSMLESILRSASIGPAEFQRLVARQSGLFQRFDVAPVSENPLSEE